MIDHPAIERLQLYVDHRLGVPEHRSIQAHVHSCHECGEHVRELRAIMDRLEAIGGSDMELPSTFAQDMAKEVGLRREPSPPSRRSLITQAALCVVILLTCASLLLVVDTPVTDPSDDLLGAIDVLLGSPFEIQASIIAVLAIMVLAGLGVLACLLSFTPSARARRRLPVASRHSDHHR